MTRDERLRVWMFAAEAAPFAKAGGLADVVGSLPKALERIGVEPTVILPGYRSALSGPFGLSRCGQAPAFDVPMGPSTERAEIYQTRIEKTAIDVYCVGSARYFDRSGIYDDPRTHEGYSDNMERFVFFMKAGLELAERLGAPVDILHCHDSHAALIPGMVRAHPGRHPRLAARGTLLTIHNIAYQGIYPSSSLEYAGIDRRHFFPMSPFEYWGQVNFMKAGIECADKINTVSQTYAREIQTAEYGMGLEDVLRRRHDDVSGIVNGADYEVWNPETDPLIPAPYSARNLGGKAECRRRLMEHLGLPERDRVPLVGIVSRLADQKGFDLIAEAMGELMALDLQMVVLGTGQKKYHDLWSDIAKRYPEKVAVRLVFDNRLAHWIEAGCDMFLMPSRYEPCGLNQIYSLRYGTVPIVHATGGLADTVSPYDGKGGTGFSFAPYSSREMTAAVRRALALFADGGRWRDLAVRGMSQDWSWDRSAAEYLRLYRSVLSGRPPAP